MCDSYFSLCPRGYGRTSYRLAESIQLGRVPVVLYSDVLWVPYPHLFEKYGYAASFSNVRSVLDQLTRAGSADIAQRESFLTSISESHFSFLGVIEQISLFLLHGHSESDLRCQPLPASKRDEKWCRRFGLHKFHSGHSESDLRCQQCCGQRYP